MRCTDPHDTTPAPHHEGPRPWASLALMFALAAPAGWLAGCATRVPVTVAPPTPTRPTMPTTPSTGSSPTVRTWDEYRQRAALRLVAANASLTYAGVPPEPLLAIPVLEVELRADGSIAKIDVLRYPSQAKDTTQIAIDAVRRAAPFGDVGRLPKPWRYVETFLFNDDRKFKPMTLDR